MGRIVWRVRSETGLWLRQGGARARVELCKHRRTARVWESELDALLWLCRYYRREVLAGRTPLALRVTRPLGRPETPDRTWEPNPARTAKVAAWEAAYGAAVVKSGSGAQTGSEK